MRVSGSKTVGLVECINPINNRYKVRWDIKKDGEAASWIEHNFDHRPTLAEIRAVVLQWYNAEIDRKILSGFVWRDMSVWLSSENQFNYKAAFDLATQMQGENGTLPVTFKFGTDEEPVYFEFVDMETFTDFYIQSIAYRNSVLTAGWAEKDATDWKAYEVSLQEIAG